MVDSDRWLYLVVTFIKVKTIVVVASLKAKTGINAIFPFSKKKNYSRHQNNDNDTILIDLYMRILLRQK
jgi:hypothetical protein